MSSTSLAFEAYLDAVATEAGRLAAVTAGVLAQAVPSCPEWCARDLVEHVWHVYTFWHAQVLAADVSASRELGDRTLPAGGEPGECLEEAADELVRVIGAAGPQAPCWNWSGQDFTTAWLARRMALESAVHRYDGELTAHDPTPIDARLAADGIDEFLTVHLPSDLSEVPTATLGGSLCLACSDTENAWTVDASRGHLRVRHDRGPASAYLRGATSDLFLFVWNRVGVDDLELTGDRAVAAAWALLPH